ncbi:hypothetical protein E1287_07470 [Actinomadura sp. KC06]|uniref:hypothetical protein n=1 Tax=Actinomadura sp. KC06 TaxID=2530369 RepID=UPI001047B7EF|nr:hypothetical protein [Actinomadura sp. KC06]TDD37887.1 hypothetical protein E1287_07470 [Actinomadura sp. KC06]
MAAVSALPPPISVTDHYLAAIHDRLGEICDRLPAKAEQPAEGQPVELREPAPPPATPPRPLTEPARPARKPPARKAAARTPPRTRTRKGT